MTTQQALTTYLDSIIKTHKHKEASEHAYRPALEALLESLGEFDAINDPNNMKVRGKPDFIVKDRKSGYPVAFAEAKDIGVDLNKVARSDQLKGYLSAMPNLLLTDYLEFRWYYKEELKVTARLAEVVKGKIQPIENGLEAVASLLNDYAVAQTPTVHSAEDLAGYMASMARNVATLIEHYR
jgi:hypothetical protein